MDIYFISSSTHVHLKIKEYQRQGGIETDSGRPSHLQKPFWGIQLLFVEKGFILLDLPWVQKSRFKQLLIHKRIIPCSSGIYCRDARFLNSHQLISVIHHINSWRLKTIRSSIDAQKVLTKFKCHLWLKKKKTLQKVSTDGPHLNIIKTVYVKHTANIILNRGKLKAWIRQERSLLPLLLNIFLEVLATTKRKEKETNGIQFKKN